MKVFKGILKGIAFLLILCTVLLTAQHVLRYKGEYAENMKDRIDSAKTQLEEGKIDVLICGSSPVYAGISPAVLYGEEGITGMNLGASYQNSMSVYYELLYLFDYGTPELLVLDFNDLYNFRLPDDKTYYPAFYKAMESMPLKYSWPMMKDIISRTGSIEWLFPIYREHTRWESLERDDLWMHKQSYREFTKGTLMNTKQVPLEFDMSAFEPSAEPAEINGDADSYYSKILELCREKNVKVACAVMPHLNLGKRMSRQVLVMNYCDENGIPYINYTDPENFLRADLDPAKDFYNEGHTNAYGNVKLSRDFSYWLRENFSLPDRRDDPAYKDWDETSMLFRQEYSKYIK